MADDSEREDAAERRERALARRKRKRRADPLATPVVAEAPTNPYAPPRDEGASRARGRKRKGYRDASKARRFANFVIDTFAMALLALVLIERVLDVAWTPGVPTLVEIILTLLYYGFCESVFGRTLGKLVTGTMVVTLDGEAPGLGKALHRSVVRLVPFEPFSFLGAYPTGWHDRWSETRVVMVEGR